MLQPGRGTGVRRPSPFDPQPSRFAGPPRRIQTEPSLAHRSYPEPHASILETRRVFGKRPLGTKQVCFASQSRQAAWPATDALDRA